MSGFDLNALIENVKKGLLILAEALRDKLEAVREMMANGRLQAMLANVLTLIVRAIDAAKAAAASHEESVVVAKKERHVRLRARLSDVAHRRRERRPGRVALWAANLLLDAESSERVADDFRDDVETRKEEGVRVSRWIGVQFLWRTVGPLTIDRLRGQVAMRVGGR